MVKYVILLVFGLLAVCGCSTIPSEDEPAMLPQNEATGSHEIELIILYDNNPFDPRLQESWGFACLVRLPEKTVLFDTGGDSATLLHNMRALEIDPAEIDAIVLSHIHGDHVGGLQGLLEENSDVIVHLPQSFPQGFKDGVRSLGAKVHEVSKAEELFARGYTTGELGSGIIEQSLIITTSKGLVVITGCAHPGVVHIIRTAKNIFPQERVYFTMGGFHLTGTSTSRIESIIKEFRQLSVNKVAPCHCSGDEARRMFREEYGEDYIDSGVGKTINLP
jgi:7,8-dihydropterin-6-yl-methyl-4-(beta-D-ribofuranosyl)aminobenzene 5'-phosphate synthase